MKACFIGLGSIGTRHILNLSRICNEENIPLEIHAVRHSDRPLKAQLQSLNMKSLRSYSEMDSFYDMIFLTNPTSLHYETLMQVGDKSKYFFIEKPVFENWNEDIEILPLTKDAICYVAAPLRYTAVIRKAGEFVQKHRIYSARAISSSYLPDWRPGLDYRQTYSARKALGGGVSIDLIHEWDYLSMLFGMPEKVYSLIGKYSQLEIDSDDLAVYIAKYRDHLIELHLDYFGRKTRRELELYAEDGCWKFDITNSCVVSPEGSCQFFSEELNDRYVREMRYFLSLLSGKENKSWNTIEHACQVLRITKGG